MSKKQSMQEKHLFEYSVIRIVPRVERSEFSNVGVILYCPAQRFLQTMFEINREKLLAIYKEVDLEEIKDRLKAFEQICKGSAKGGTIGKLPLASRFRWLTAARSTVLQTSPVHPGFCRDAEETLMKLHAQQVQ